MYQKKMNVNKSCAYQFELLDQSRSQSVLSSHHIISLHRADSGLIDGIKAQLRLEGEFLKSKKDDHLYCFGKTLDPVATKKNLIRNLYQ